MTTKDKEILKVSPSCHFELDKWNGLSLNYTEYATDHWNSNTDTSIAISKEEAQNIVDFLFKAYPEVADANRFAYPNAD